VHASNLRTLCVALNAKDHYTLGHTARVAAYMVMLGRELGWSDEAVRTVGEAAYLHDIGKIGISDRVLTKVGKLNDREWELMRQHPVLSAEIVRPLYDDDVVPACATITSATTAAATRRPGRRGDPADRARDVRGRLLRRDVVRAALSSRPELHAVPGRARALQGQRSSTRSWSTRSLRVLRGSRRRGPVPCAIGEQAPRRSSTATRTPRSSRAAPRTIPAYRQPWPHQLRAARDAEPGVRFVTTMARRGDRSSSCATPRKTKRSAHTLGDEVVGDEEVAHVLAGEHPDICVVSADEFGVWISAMTPITTPTARSWRGVGRLPGLRGRLKRSAALRRRQTLTKLLRRRPGARDRVAELDAITDTLTGLYNHRYLHEGLARRDRPAQEAGESFRSCCATSITSPRSTGRSAIPRATRRCALIGQLVESASRRADLCARFGGDEFALVLTDAGAERALEVAEALRAAIGAAGIGGAAGTGDSAGGPATRAGSATRPRR
jgi:GGDEF domain-containing protein